MYIRLCYQTKLQHPSTETTESVLRCVGYRSKRNPEGLAGAFWILDPKEDLLRRTVGKALSGEGAVATCESCHDH